MKIKNLIVGIALSALLGGGVSTAIATNSIGNKIVAAATNTTVYYAVPSDVVGSYTVKLNINRQGDADNWQQYDMTRDGTKTQGGNDLYVVNFTDLYDGVGVMQFQLYDGETWKSQEQAISSWTFASTYNNKVYLYDDEEWAEYNPDVKVTKYGVYNGTVDLDYPLGTDLIEPGSTYSVPTPIYKSGNEFGGWYKDTACTQAYTERAISTDTPLYAKYTWKGVVKSGTAVIDLRSSGFANVAANYAIYYFDNTTYTEVASGWSDYQSLAANNYRLTISYSLPFVPLKMILMRYNSTYSKESWETDPWDTSVWFHSADLSYSDYLSVSDYNQSTSYWTAYSGDEAFPNVQGQSSGGSWGDISYIFRSSGINSDGHMFYWYSPVELTANSQFKMVHAGGWYGFNNVTTHESLTGVFSSGTNDNIVCSTADSYYIEFDSVTHDVYISTPALESADEWASKFLGTDVDIDTCEHSKHYWDSVKDSVYPSVILEARQMLLDQPHIGPNDPATTLIARAIQRYDYVIQLYGTNKYEDYIGRVDAGKITITKPVLVIGNFSNDKTTPIALVIVISLIGLGSIGGYFYLRKRKQD